MKKIVLALLLSFFTLFLCADEVDKLTDSIISEFSREIDLNNYGIGIGNFVYAEHNIASSFSNYLSEKFSTSISKHPQFELIDREKIDLIMEEVKLSLSGFIDDSTAIEAGEVEIRNTDSAFSILGEASEKIVARGLSVNAKQEQISEILLNYTIVE